MGVAGLSFACAPPPCCDHTHTHPSHHPSLPPHTRTSLQAALSEHLGYDASARAAALTSVLAGGSTAAAKHREYARVLAEARGGLASAGTSGAEATPLGGDASGRFAPSFSLAEPPRAPHQRAVVRSVMVSLAGMQAALEELGARPIAGAGVSRDRSHD